MSKSFDNEESLRRYEVYKESAKNFAIAVEAAYDNEIITLTPYLIKLLAEMKRNRKHWNRYLENF